MQLAVGRRIHWHGLAPPCREADCAPTTRSCPKKRVRQTAVFLIPRSAPEEVTEAARLLTLTSFNRTAWAQASNKAMDVIAA
nr:hypothetical protein BDOA9_0201190 [Bradyrhizobium sp. DOA9]